MEDQTKEFQEMKTILLDVDGVIADFTGALFVALRKRGHEQYTDEDLTEWDLKKCLPKSTHLALEHIAHERGFCSSIPRYEGAQAFYKQLRTGNKVLALTTAWKGSTWTQERYDWLVSFGFNDPEIFIVESHDHKKFFAGDALIEDRIETLRDWRGGGKKILIDKPWNRSTVVSDKEHGIVRCYTYADVLKAINE